MDPIRERAALIVLQEARVQKAIKLEQQLEGVLLPVVGQEIERLAKLWDSYEAAFQRMGFVRQQDGLVDQVSTLPEEQRQELAAVLERIREARARARIATVEAGVQAMMPPGYPRGEGEGSEAGRSHSSPVPLRVHPDHTENSDR